jgi:hypothetical protein
MSAPARLWSPLSVASAHDVPLDLTTVWIKADLVPGARYRLRALVEGAAGTTDRAVLVRFDGAGVGGTGLSMSKNIGVHLYLRTGPELHRTDRVITVGSRVRRIGLCAGGERDHARLKTFVIERVDEPNPPTDFFLSFDVEAAPERTTGDPIDALVWGRLNGGQYGIPRICQVLEQHGLIGNFMIDFVTCASRGDAALREIVDYLRGRGHEIHLHLHPEYLDPSLGFRHNGKSIHLDRAPYDLSRSLLDLALDRYRRSGGQPPYVFRAGGYRISEHLLRAAADVGITAMTNVKPHTVADVAPDGDGVPYREPFVWDNGILEIPVDISSPEVSPFRSYVTKCQEALARKAALPTVNLVMHSWSLLRRNGRGHHDSFAPDYEAQLHAICEHTVKHGRARGYAEYVSSPPALRVRRIRDVRIEKDPPTATAGCNICGADIAGGDCPSCRCGSAHRQLRFGLDEYGDIRVGRDVLGVNLTPAEHRAFAVRGFHGGLADASCDGVVWLDGGLIDVIPREASRVLRPGGVLVVAGSDGGPHLEAVARSLPAFIPTTVPVMDPVTGETGQLGLFYKPGGRVRLNRPPRLRWRLVAVRTRANHLVRGGARGLKRLMRRARATLG